jgi:hypothetical protein
LDVFFKNNYGLENGDDNVRERYYIENEKTIKNLQLS